MHAREWIGVAWLQASTQHSRASPHLLALLLASLLGCCFALRLLSSLGRLRLLLQQLCSSLLSPHSFLLGSHSFLLRQVSCTLCLRMLLCCCVCSRLLRPGSYLPLLACYLLSMPQRLPSFRSLQLSSCQHRCTPADSAVPGVQGSCRPTAPPNRLAAAPCCQLGRASDLPAVTNDLHEVSGPCSM